MTKQGTENAAPSQMAQPRPRSVIHPMKIIGTCIVIKARNTS